MSEIFEFQIATSCPEIQSALELVAKKAGYKWIREANQIPAKTHYQFLLFGIGNQGRTIWAEYNHNKSYGELITIDEAFKRLLEKLKEKEIKIDKYSVILSQDKNMIHIGCQKIPKEKVKEILDTLNIFNKLSI